MQGAPPVHPTNLKDIGWGARLYRIHIRIQRDRKLLIAHQLPENCVRFIPTNLGKAWTLTVLNVSLQDLTLPPVTLPPRKAVRWNEGFGVIVIPWEVFLRQGERWTEHHKYFRRASYFVRTRGRSLGEGCWITQSVDPLRKEPSGDLVGEIGQP